MLGVRSVRDLFASIQSLRAGCVSVCVWLLLLLLLTRTPAVCARSLDFVSSWLHRASSPRPRTRPLPQNRIAWHRTAPWFIYQQLSPSLSHSLSLPLALSLDFPLPLPHLLLPVFSRTAQQYRSLSSTASGLVCAVAWGEWRGGGSSGLFSKTMDRSEDRSWIAPEIARICFLRFLNLSCSNYCRCGNHVKNSRKSPIFRT